MKKETTLKIVRFGISGGIGASLSVAILYGFTEYAKIWYLLSFIISFIISDILSFLLKKFWVFENQPIKEAKLQIFLYFGLSLIYLMVNTGLLLIFVEYLQIEYIISQIIIIFVLLGPNYLLSRKIFIVQKTQ